MGRGALAGPVVVCAAAFEQIPDDDEVRDSKLLTPRRREHDRVATSQAAVHGGWCVRSGRESSTASTSSKRRAWPWPLRRETLVIPNAVVITDHVNPGDLGCRVLSPKKADRDYFCVAAASIWQRSIVTR